MHQRPSLQRLRARTIDEVVEGDPRDCDACGSEALYGCAVAMRAGLRYDELCQDCAVALVKDAIRLAPHLGIQAPAEGDSSG